MSPLEDEELLAMMRGMETDRVEWKESFKGSSPASIREAVCAFANDISGHRAPGVVFIGLRDDGSPADNFAVTDELLLQLASIKTDGNITPPPSMLVQKRRLGGVDLAVITVWAEKGDRNRARRAHSERKAALCRPAV
jgi:ATP-dependent DNA helicase RecG